MHKVNFLLGGSMVAVMLALVVGIPLYAAGHLTADFDKFIEFKPLVRHMISQVHCYDEGTDDCETTDHLGASFTKEHTLGFLVDGSTSKMRRLGLEPVYVCEDRDDSGVMMVTAGTLEEDPKDACRDADFRPDHVGYISPTDEIEAPFELYRCVHPTTNDTLLTHDPNECSAATYGPAELMGYLYAGGPLVLE